MEKIIYLVRHSGPFVNINNYEDKTFDEQSRNMILSVEGEKRAENLSKIGDLKNIEKVMVSNSARAIETAKYIAYENNISLDVLDTLNERKFGIKYIKELPADFITKQFKDENYKLKNGESLFEVKTRINPIIKAILEDSNLNKVAIVIHGISLMTILSTMCDVKFDNDVFKVIFNNQVIYNQKLKNPDIFKLTFKDEQIIQVENIKYN